MNPPLRLFPILATLALGACGAQEGARTASADQVPVRDTTVPPIQREPLTAADEVGLEPMNLSVELPWMRNQASRDPAEAAAPSTLLELETLSAEGFDRAIFHFTTTAPFPGYQVRLENDPSTVTCDDAEAPLTEGPLLVVRLHPVRIEEGAPGTGDLREVGQGLFQEAGIVCRTERELTWVARIDGGEEVRVLELRDPERLAVDLR